MESSPNYFKYFDSKRQSQRSQEPALRRSADQFDVRLFYSDAQSLAFDPENKLRTDLETLLNKLLNQTRGGFS